MGIDPPEDATADIGKAQEIQGGTVPISGKLTVIAGGGSTAKIARFVKFRTGDLQI
ncbi:hypothetical protein GRI34_00155 [Erythrobacter aquimaris]|uniref:Uncharacterized protein n=1 Tax=Qipengyuania aquimaris TaxID=255984 RepID=A0A6I4TI50_9SPHN|nr:hypothetical protein [Qipengyuania aquimaris]MXO94827.1 hypothetical protein [Qipengyuania aquimaris]